MPSSQFRVSRGRAVVGDEECQGVVGFTEACEFVHDGADGVVDGGDHGGHDASVPWEVGEAFGVLCGRVHGVMRRVEGCVEKEGLAGGALFGDHGSEAFDGFFGDEFREVFAVVPDLFVVLPEVVCGIDARTGSVCAPVVDVGVEVDASGEEAEPVVEAVTVRTTFVGQAEVPLADHGCLVSAVFKERGDCGC